MAVNPAFLKTVAKIAVTAVRDERTRQVILVACLVPFIIILLVLSSPFAIFFSVTGDGGNADAISIHQTMDSLKNQFEEKIREEKEDDTVDEFYTVIMGSEDNTIIDNSADVLIAYSVKYNVTNKDAEQMAVLTDNQISKLENVFWDMNQITSKIETVKEKKTYTTTNKKGKKITKTKTITKKIKTIYIDCLSAEEIASIYNFDKTQLRVIEEMKKSGIVAFVGNNISMTTLNKEQIAEIKELLPEDLSIEREHIVETACSILGKVNYFWGGKSKAIGWDNRWGKLMTVTSKGSPTTGSKRPFGLDCSGYVTWVFVNMGIPAESINETIGQGTTQQWNLSNNISENLVLPGDLAFLAVPGTRKVNHIGIVVGKDKKGSILVAHCASGANNVVVKTAESVGFMYYRRPAVLME
ncbi:C40 family peptidase [Clostridiisalibacter paucivorans]|uniref:C40 family peptidase n=1 Tax=Clostridiisalibacter paucivorans TaxID=408753 RepID=UPI00047EB00C|nr:NlpC/P60 family protein [Clostridiisalibacter paucivorans]